MGKCFGKAGIRSPPGGTINANGSPPEWTARAPKGGGGGGGEMLDGGRPTSDADEASVRKLADGSGAEPRSLEEPGTLGNFGSVGKDAAPTGGGTRGGGGGGVGTPPSP
mmetsp:Transcript_14898/g.30864  ORF Transcript_14898/g.30864 Transcript_14898/m.30864 type:complete len:109 (-) Transcript_14898:118-444(-)